MARDNIRKHAKASADEAKKAASAAGQEAKLRASQAKERLNDELAHMKEKMRQMEERVDNYVREHPKQSLLIAAGVGALVGAALVSAIRRR